MSYILGIDIGGSTTKIAGFKDNQIIGPLFVKANDPIASLYGAFGKFLSLNGLSLSDIERIMITGAGSSFVTEKIYGIKTGKVDEFRAIGAGGLFLSRLPKALIVSMGTGTAFVMADGTTALHLGGSGVGGGTLLGLSYEMLNLRNFNDLIETANGGNLSNIDLSIGDITQDVLEGLPPEITASNFGKISDLATKSDKALAIINLVFQTIGMLSIFATKIHKINDVILTGNLVNVPQSHEIFKILSQLHNVNFHIPDKAEYATAAGAAICYSNGIDFYEIG